MYRAVWLLTITIAFFAGCTDEKFSKERTELLEAKTKWERAKTTSVSGYRFNSESSCFCFFVAPRKVSLTVTFDKISAAFDRDSLKVVTDSLLKNYLTIDQWFTKIDTLLDRDPDYARIIYDETLGYPKDIYIDNIKNAVDDEFSHKNDSLQLIYKVVM